MNSSHLVLVHSLETLGEHLSLGWKVEPKGRVFFGRKSGTKVRNQQIDVAMLDSQRRQTTTVSGLAGMVSRDAAGRPILSNLSRNHRLHCCRWPHLTPEVIAECGPNQDGNPPSKMLTAGWWWVYNVREPRAGWVLVSVEPLGRPGRGRPRQSQSGDTDPALRPEPYRLSKVDTEVFVSYFAEWFELPPRVSPRVKTQAEANDIGGSGKARILRALRQAGDSESSNLGRFGPELLVRAVDEGTVSFGEVYEALASLGRI